MSKERDNSYFEKFLTDIFGEEPFDPDTYDPRAEERDKQIRENLQTINARSTSLLNGVRKRQTVLDEGLSVSANRQLKESDITVDHMVDRTVDPADVPSNVKFTDKLAPSQLDEIASTPKRKAVLQAILSSGNMLTSYRQLSTELCCSNRTIQAILNTWESRGIISKSTYRKGNTQGFKLSILLDEKTQKKLLKDLASDPFADLSVDHTVDPTADYTGDPLLKKKIKESISLKTKLLSWSEREFEEWFPLLCASGFRFLNFRQMLEQMDKRGKSLELVTKSLEFAEWELAHGGIKGKDDKVIEKPNGYFFTCMINSGVFRQPKDYVDPQMVEMEKLKKQQNEIDKAKAQLEDKQFEAWYERLGDEETEKLEKELALEKAPISKRMFFRMYWKKNIRT